MSASILAFGSVCRRDDYDRLSDRDLLIASDDQSERRRLGQLYQRAGWSVAEYSWQKLEQIVGGRLLFAKHLRDESKPLRDSDGRIRDTLASYRDPTDFRAMKSDALRLFNITNTFPDTVLGRAWAADCLAVAVRNQTIITLAECEISEFSYSRGIEYLARVKRLDKEEQAALQSLRGFKQGFRRSSQSLLAPDRCFFARLEPLINRLFEFNGNFSALPGPELMSRVRAEWKLARSDYERMRLFEKVAVALTVRKSYRLLDNPRDYARIFGTKGYWERHLECILQRYEASEDYNGGSRQRGLRSRRLPHRLYRPMKPSASFLR